jgi:3D (Asp-Asp-Asp) domain-containing protein
VAETLFPEGTMIKRVGRPGVKSWLAVLPLGLALGLVWACGPRPGEPAPAVAVQSLLPAPPAAAAEPPAAVREEVEARRRLEATLAELRQAEERLAARRAEEERPGSRAVPVLRRVEMSSTGYCLRGRTRTGVRTRDGIAAGDPAVLPLGSVVRVTHPGGEQIGVFVIMDTGGAIRGNKIDLYMESCGEARAWGRKPVVVEVLGVGRS